MCLIYFAHEAHPDYALILAGNRDEFYERPASRAHFWEDSPDVLGGRDKQAGGSWLAVRRSGIWATVTNYRDPAHFTPRLRSRGALVADYVMGEKSADELIETARERREEYSGFNLLLGRPGQVEYYSNVSDARTKVEPGVYALSNAFLDTPWPKARTGKNEFQETISSRFRVQDLLAVLSDESIAPDEELPSTGIPIEMERLASARFIRSERYGTRAQTVLLIKHTGEIEFFERVFGPGGERVGEDLHFQFSTADRVADA